MKTMMMTAHGQAADGVRALFEMEPELLDHVSGGCDFECQCPNPQVSQTCGDGGCGPVHVDC